MRFFYLSRDTDVSGVSGTGRVAEGVVFDEYEYNTAQIPAYLIWLKKIASHGRYNSIEDILRIHGHEGNTRLLFEKPPATFNLNRKEDFTGKSRTGIVSSGVVFSNGWCLMRWNVTPYSEVWYPSVDSVEEIHGHQGRTILQFESNSYFEKQQAAIKAIHLN